MAKNFLQQFNYLKVHRFDFWEVGEEKNTWIGSMQNELTPGAKRAK